MRAKESLITVLDSPPPFALDLLTLSLALEQEQTFARTGTGSGAALVAPLSLGEVGIFQLINALRTVIKRVEAREELREIFGEHFTVSEKIDSILQRVAGGMPLAEDPAGLLVSCHQHFLHLRSWWPSS